MSVGGARTGALHRSLRAITVGAIDAHTQRRDAYAAGGLQEIDHQFQVPIQGYAAWDQIVVGTIDCEFAAPLIDAYDDRQSPFSDPTFTYGFVLTTATPVMLTAAVQKWDLRDDYFYYGARVRVMAYVPFVPDDGGASLTDTPPPQFRGEIHMNFEGFGQPQVDEPDSGEGEG